VASCELRVDIILGRSSRTFGYSIMHSPGPMPAMSRIPPYLLPQIFMRHYYMRSSSRSVVSLRSHPRASQSEIYAGSGIWTSENYPSTHSGE
jgi:hypothetical protein